MRRDLNLPSPALVAEMEHRFHAVFHHSLARRLRLLAIGGVAAGWVTFCLWKMDVSSASLWEGIGKLGWLLHFLFPPSHGGWLGTFCSALGETLAMAFLGTFLAFVAAVPFGFLGARNVFPNRVVHFGMRRFFDAVRGVDSLIWALIFISVVGLGPFAGVLALAVSDMGTLSKLFAEAIENIDGSQVDGVRSTGANRLQVMRYAMTPQIFPIMLSSGLYFFETNTRSATILGVVGAGGIGLQLADRIRINNWDQVAFIVIMILITVALIDTSSKKIRHYFIGESFSA
jgi:phosphonate transport system permease protein